MDLLTRVIVGLVALLGVLLCIGYIRLQLIRREPSPLPPVRIESGPNLDAVNRAATSTPTEYS